MTNDTNDDKPARALSGAEPGMRRLPWSDKEGKQCYVVSNSDGFLAKLADRIEEVQLSNANRFIEISDDLLSLETKVSTDELRLLVAHLREALSDVVRVAVSRGDRLPSTDAVDLKGDKAVVQLVSTSDD